ncbi:DUF2268 domain-containing putative Zn-dependent protease [Streptomyces sp. ID03-2B]|uniref:DUF2268 domain-containing protein n=1 Tax=Streptomyces caviscabies TaxID=90079 RepID=A0ABW2MAI3_9ACTN|nr:MULTISPECIES: DUF2268 domain-containing putative Zn-dependent protease [Streptomyces]MCX4711832.1 DUF2268 domain-containing protein [Streptomyces griseus]MDX3505438.1 DUF2268 domain-containing putative Zn-dependent protease [Streptomyces sp. ATCC51928]MDX3592899.1 DUF2268 domain-containing putative Zn-dependent protease [Streptomyces sp. ID03-2B]MDX5520031.1 DUF2268 domain-containing putative Zn-dependent protease [Streptomyces sp. DE06-01C]QXQ99595.1 DUF2268 domain-containing protein [Stre
MKIVVHDTASALLGLLRRPVAQRPDALREMYAPLQEVMSSVGVGDLVETHRAGSGFPLDRDDPRLLPALERMREARVWQRIEDSLAAAQERLGAAAPGARTAGTVQVVLALGDPDDPLLSLNQGYFGLGGIPGAILLMMWPTETGLAKIGHAAAHELHHNVRYANVTWDPMAVTVGEQVVAEGLAEAFVRELAGEAAMGPWATSLHGPELDEVCAKVAAGIDVAGMAHLSPYVFGDRTARRLGQEPVGLPDFAGYAAGLRFVDAHLAATGLTAAASVALPAREILAAAGVPTAA